QLGLESADVGVDIVFFDAEDYGRPEWMPSTENGYRDWCLGSQFWAQNPHRPGYRARFGILLDMVGASDAVFHQEGTSLRFAPHVVRKVWKRASDLGFGNRFNNSSTPPTIDDNFFVSDLAGIPSANIVDYRIQVRPMGYGPFHHTHADNMSVIDRETLRQVGTTVLSVVRQP
ncbi:MAG: M28 family peptidase, partial [Flavobacteriales bacterium]